MILEFCKLTVSLIFCLREKVNCPEELSINLSIHASCVLFKLPKFFLLTDLLGTENKTPWNLGRSSKEKVRIICSTYTLSLWTSFQNANKIRISLYHKVSQCPSHTDITLVRDMAFLIKYTRTTTEIFCKGGEKLSNPSTRPAEQVKTWNLWLLGLIPTLLCPSIYLWPFPLKQSAVVLYKWLMTGAPAENYIITELIWIKNRKHILATSFISIWIIDFPLDHLQNW